MRERPSLSGESVSYVPTVYKCSWSGHVYERGYAAVVVSHARGWLGIRDVQVYSKTFRLHSEAGIIKAVVSSDVVPTFLIAGVSPLMRMRRS